MEILINNQLLDGIVNADIAISKALNNLHEVKARVGNFSTQIRTFKTKNNQAIAGRAHLIGAGSIVPYTRYEAIILADGCQAIRGFAVLEESDEYYNWRVYGGNADLFNLIKDRKLDDLNLARFDHNWQDDSVESNRAAYSSWETGYIYPDIDYGKWTNSTYGNRIWSEFYPAVHSKMILWQMCVDAGYTPAGDFWESNDLFAAEILPFTRNNPRFSDVFRADKFVKLSQSNSDYTIPVSAGRISFQKMLLNTKEGGWTYNPGTGVLTPTESNFDLEITFKGRLKLDYNAASSGIYLVAYYFRIYQGASVIKVFAQMQKFIITAGTGTIYFDVDTSAVQQFSTNSIKCDISISASLLGIGLDLFWTAAKFLQGGYINFQLGKKGYPGCHWNIASNLPDMSQSDFLSTILNQFGVLVDCDPRLKVARFITLNQVAENKAIAPNWSNKVDLSKAPVLKYKLDGYGQRNVFRYQADDKDKFLTSREDFGKGLITIENENLDSEKKVFESKFAPVWRGDSFSGAQELAQIQMFVDEKDNQIKPRIAYLSVQEVMEGSGLNIIKDTPSDNAAYIFGNGGGSVVSATKQFEVYFDALRFDTGLIPNYYQPLIGILNPVQAIEIYLNLNPVDVELLQLDVPVFLDIDTETHGQICGYFYINLIDQFQVNKLGSTKVVLVKI